MVEQFFPSTAGLPLGTQSLVHSVHWDPEIKNMWKEYLDTNGLLRGSERLKAAVRRLDCLQKWWLQTFPHPGEEFERKHAMSTATTKSNNTPERNSIASDNDIGEPTLHVWDEPNDGNSSTAANGTIGQECTNMLETWESMVASQSLTTQSTSVGSRSKPSTISDGPNAPRPSQKNDQIDAPHVINTSCLESDHMKQPHETPSNRPPTTPSQVPTRLPRPSTILANRLYLLDRQGAERRNIRAPVIKESPASQSQMRSADVHVVNKRKRELETSLDGRIRPRPFL